MEAFYCLDAVPVLSPLGFGPTIQTIPEFGLDIRHFAVLVGPIPGASSEPLHLLRDSFNLIVPCDLAPTCLIFKTTSVMKKAADVEERSWVPFFIY